MRLRYIYLCFLTMLSFIAPARGQTSGGSSIASLTVLSSDTTKVFERRVYDNGLGDRVLHHTAKPNIARTFGVMPPELTPVQTLNADTTDYLLGGSLVMTNGTVDKVLFDGGFADVSSSGSFVLFYYNKDHLGNNREALIRSGSVFQVTRYYPFGAQYSGSTEISGVNIQPYKYNFSIEREKRKVACSSEREKNRPKVSGKELDTMHGLDTYDYGARQYYPILGRWDRMDPLCEKYYSISPYAYCLGNPVKFVDIFGMAPGDRFKNPTLAAIDFGITYNVVSIQTNKELSSYIYKMKDKNGKTYYTYPGPAKGSKANVSKEDMKSIDRSKISVNEFIDVLANIHTHGSELGNYENNIFSGEQATPKQNKEWRGEKRRGNGYEPDDISEANRTQTYSYVVTPNGELRGYDPKTGKVTVWSTKMPTSDKEVNNSGKTDSNNSIWERVIRFIKSL